ncbi:MAG: TlpA family protein disulfide reductase [Myxococcales bacterium]|nr:TlpA family protein disulfide reductase [Myxococcales bacterium]
MAPAKSSYAPAFYLAFVLLAGVLVYSFVASAQEGELRRRCAPTCLLRPDYAGHSRTLPSFTLPDMKGAAVSSDAFKGKVIVLNFWTKTCGPCLEEMPEIVDLTRILKDRGDVVVLTISTDDGPDDVRSTLQAVIREEPPFPVLFDPDSKIVGGKFGTRLFPETWIVDKKGVIRARFDGARAWSNPAVVELVDQIRAGGYCPIDVNEGRTSGLGARICGDLGAGGT